MPGEGLSQPPAKSDGVDLLNFDKGQPKFSVAIAGSAYSFSDPHLNCAYRCNVSLEAKEAAPSCPQCVSPGDFQEMLQWG